MPNQLTDISIRDLLAVLVSLGVFVLILFKIAVPDQIWSAWLVILTFFFTQKPLNGNGTTTPKTGGTP